VEDMSRKQAVAVIADAVNLLSNAWDPNNPGYKPTDGSILPTASPTNYNFAMVTGNVPTPNGGTATNPVAYSGGLENLPRFQENWQNSAGRIAANYRGAMVNLFASSVAKQAWGQGGVYNPPPGTGTSTRTSSIPASLLLPPFPRA